MRLFTTLSLMTICLAARAQVDTEFKYGDSIFIQNSSPRAGGNADVNCRYTDSVGQKYRYAIFWTRVVNEAATPLELTVHFPATLPSPYAPIKLFLPRYALTDDKLSLYNYGITGLKSYLDRDFNSTSLKRTIPPKEEYRFYVVLLSPLDHEGGTLRTGFVLKEQNLLYNIKILPKFEPALFSCGKIVLIKSKK